MSSSGEVARASFSLLGAQQFGRGWFIDTVMLWTRRETWPGHSNVLVGRAWAGTLEACRTRRVLRCGVRDVRLFFFGYRPYC